MVKKQTEPPKRGPGRPRQAAEDQKIRVGPRIYAKYLIEIDKRFGSLQNFIDYAVSKLILREK